jgi:predicted PurR-regulated permease PerM
MAEPPEPSRQRPPRHRGLAPLLVGAVTLAFGWVVLPFYGPILWASIIALLFAPLYRRLRQHLKMRNLAALLTLLAVLLIVVLPLALIAAALARETSALYQRVQSGEWNPLLFFRAAFDALPSAVRGVLDRFALVDFAALQARLTSVLSRGSEWIATQALGIGQNTFEVATGLAITVYLAFFLIRDGESVARAVREAIPLAPAHRDRLIDTFRTAIRATVKGQLLVGAIQGMLGGLAFWFLDVHGALLWAVAMAFLSLVPVVGAAIVWLPVAAYFVITGAVWQGLALAAWGVVVIGLVDNLLRPALVGRQTLMPDYLVMVATLGGVATLGINGLVLGPALAALFLAVWKRQTQPGDPPSSTA